MSQAIQPPHFETRLNRAIAYSVGLHLAVAAALTLKTVIYPSEPMELENAVRVDIVSLPDKAPAQLPAAPPPAAEAKPVEAPPPKAEPEPAPKPAPKAEVAKPEPAPAKPEAPKVNLSKSKQDQQAALKRLEALQRLERTMKNQASTAAPVRASAEKSDTAPGQLVKGNEISRGSDLRGLARLEHQSYLRTIDTKVRANWNLPQWLLTSNLKMRVRLYVDSHGNVVKKSVTESSGQPIFDEKVMEAIEASSPLPPPPENLAGLLAVEGVELEFNPQRR